MKVLIIYFSQTGNTEKIAKKIQNGINKSGNDCQIENILDVKLEQIKIFDLIGLGTPTFFYREPRNIKKFINNLEPVNQKHCFLFCTHGSQIGNTFYYMKEALINKGYLIIGTFDSYSDASIQFYPTPWHTTGHPDEIELNEAEDFGKNICNISLKVHDGDLSLVPEIQLITDTLWAQESSQLTLDILRRGSPRFTINQEKCTQCLQCQNKCPSNAINIEIDPPEIQNEGCIFCWFCEKLCPEGAIEADWEAMKIRNRKNLTMYVKFLEEAEKEGKFRPYIDYKKII
ncbi:MAG: EFR1 family ferrodoxin [Promethearchaeota archaeon]